MKRLIRFGKRDAMLTLRQNGAGANAEIQWDGEALRSLSLTSSEVEPGVYSVLCGTRSYDVRVTQSHEGFVVELAGKRLVFDVEDPREVSRRGGGPGNQDRQNVSAPMPGKVVRVLVEEGAEVTKGQGLVVVEAMKMQNEMKAPKAGKVIALTARAWASVTAGQVLVTLE